MAIEKMNSGTKSCTIKINEFNELKAVTGIVA
jgi:hypothetical protein